MDPLGHHLVLRLEGDRVLTRRVPVLDQWHLADAFRYVLRQDERHGVGSDPYQEASAVTDLLGMRAFAGPIASRVREHLPRIRREHLLEHLGVTSLDEAVHVEHLVEATRAAFALPALAGRDDEAVSAGVAAVHACRVDADRLAAALGVTASSVRRMVHLDPPPLAVRAIRLQMCLRAIRPEIPAFAALAEALPQPGRR